MKLVAGEARNRAGWSGPKNTEVYAEMGRFQKGNPGRPKGAPNKATTEIKELATSFLSDPDYRAALKVRLEKGTAPAVEVLLYHYAHGKPKDTLTMEGSESLAELLQTALSRRA